MAKIDCNTEMKKYHAEEVTLPSTEQKTMRERRNADVYLTSEHGSQA